MKRCIISRLADTVDNDSLVVYGQFDLHVVRQHPWGTLATSSFAEDNTSILKIVPSTADASFNESSSVKEREYAGTSSVINPQSFFGFVCSEPCSIRFVNSEALTGIYVGTDCAFDWLSVNSIPNIEDINIAEGNNFDDFSINAMCSLVKLKYFVIQYNSACMHGKIEELIAGMADNGRTQNATGLTFKSGINVSYGNQSFNSGTFTGVLYWQKVSDVIKSYYVKTDAADVYDNVDIYCMNYTPQEIAANTASGGIWAGKNVISVN